MKVYGRQPPGLALLKVGVKAQTASGVNESIEEGEKEEEENYKGLVSAEGGGLDRRAGWGVDRFNRDRDIELI